jgi:hypothetical protein
MRPTSFIAASRLLIAAIALIALPVPSFANGPLFVCQPGQPFLWPSGGLNIPFNPDQGDLGPLTHAQAVDTVADAFQVWADVPTATATYLQGAELPVDVDITNFEPWFDPAAPDGLSAIVFDDTGEIFEELFGPDSGILGFASPEWANVPTCTITEGVAFLNGPSFDDATAALDVLVHEFGHYSNLAHTVVNGQILAFDDHSGPSPNNTFGVPAGVTVIETMYPFYFGPGSGTSSLHLDDIAGLSTLYPEATFGPTTASIRGTIFASNGTTKLTGVNVIARNIANPFLDAVSALSSDQTDAFVQTSEFTGRYTFRALTPGAQYAVFVDQILAGGFSTPPLILPGPEEFHNGAAESDGDPVADPPAVFTPVSGIAGGVTTGIDIIFNAPRPGDPLAVGDDGFVELALPFEFKFCGVTFETVFVNANGSLTFGLPSSDFTESQFEFLNGPARAAGLWDDLNPAAGGIVTFARTDHTFTVSWTNVPEFPAVGANTFAITLHRAFDLIDVKYGSLTAVDGLAGVTCGSPMTSRFEQQTNLSSKFIVELLTDPAGFEIFSPGKPFDLANKKLLYTGTLNYHDRWAGPNNTAATATKIFLPFNSSSVHKLTEIESAGDRDFFRFKAKAGQVLAIETLTGGIDSYIGLFDAAGTLLIANDDGGAGLLSRLIVLVPADGDYIVGVTTFPDTGFTGIGTETGRYVLNVRTYEGTIVPGGDDTSVAVPFPGFSFNFQGAPYANVFVNSNGNLTFGAGNTDFTETVAELLSGPPRIAPLWDDLNAATGLLLASAETGALTIHFISVPEFFTDSPNYFSVKMEAAGKVTISYDGILAQDALTGITQGGGAADPGPTDLSRAHWLSKTGTTYEQFTLGSTAALPLHNPFDLPFRNLRFQ